MGRGSAAGRRWTTCGSRISRTSWHACSSMRARAQSSARPTSRPAGRATAVDLLAAPAAVSRVLIELIDQPPQLVLAAVRLCRELTATAAAQIDEAPEVADRARAGRRVSRRAPRGGRLGTRSASPYSTASYGSRKRSRSMSLHHLVDVAIRVLRDHLGVRRVSERISFARDLDVRGRAAKAARSLVDHHLRVRQHVALAGGARREDQRAHRHRHADAVRLHVGLHELHRVVDREAGVRARRRASSRTGGCPRPDPPPRGRAAARRSGSPTLRSTSVPRKTIRSRSSREKMSNERSKRPSDSTTIGTS